MNVMVGGWEIFTRNMGKARNGRVGFVMGGGEISKVSLYSYQRGAKPLILWRSPLYCLCLPPTLLSNFVKPLNFLLTSNPTLTVLSVVLFLWLNWWSWHIWCAILLNDNMDLHKSSFGTLVPEGHWYVFYATRRHIYWCLTHNVVFYWYSDLTSHTQTHKHTQHTQGPLDWHGHINIYLDHLLCAHSS